MTCEYKYTFNFHDLCRNHNELGKGGDLKLQGKYDCDKLEVMSRVTGIIIIELSRYMSYYILMLS